MLEQYKRTFLSTQIFIAALTAIIFFKLGRNVMVTATFFATMQLGGIVGAAWGARLRRIMQSRRV